MIKQYLEIASPPAAVFEAIATPAGLAAWWTEETSGEAEVGGVLDFRFGDLYHHRMRVVEREANRRLAWQCLPGDPEPEWEGTRVEFDLEATEAGTTLRFAHTGWAELNDQVASCNQHWSRLLSGLREMCETGSPSAQRWRRD